MFYIFNGILIFLNSYIVLRFASHLHLLKYKFSIFLIIVTLITFQKLGFGHEHKLNSIENLFHSEKFVVLIYQISYLLFGIVTCLFFYTIITDILYITLKLIFSHSSPFIKYASRFYIFILILVTSVTVLLGLIITVRGPVIQRIEIPIKNLPDKFDNFRIVQISDLHVGKTIKYDYVSNVVNIVNSLNPDLITLTGDFVDGSVRELNKDIKPLNLLKSRYGTFFVTGNHEYYSGVEQWIKQFKDLGIQVLSNEHSIIKHKGEQIIIAGVTDFSTIKLQLPNASDPFKAIVGAPNNLVKILLAHQPASYIDAYKAGYDLQLSGHTHSGQYFPFTLLIRFFHKYYRGLNNYKGMWIYINRGTGYWGPPLRLGSSPEITLIVLKKS